jgi:RNA polymerase sigma-70 factor (ECF subfamily)
MTCVGTGPSLAALFCAVTKQAPGAERELEAQLGAYVAAARAACPELSIADDDFVRYLASRAKNGTPPDVRHAGDLLLACGCAAQLPAAVALFHLRYGAVIARVLSSRRASADLAADATQSVYERLLVAPHGGAPKIADYAGTGSLRSWVSTVAATTLLTMRRAALRRREQLPDSESSLEQVASSEPELRYLKARYKVEMERALGRAIERLSERERLLLRLHLTEAMSIDALGAMYSVNRATAARWLAAARAAILTGTREELSAALELGPNEWGSIAALVQSVLSVSVVRHLK